MQQKRHRFRAETRRVLDIVVNSLYSHPEIFLRELVSNASDALDRLRFESLTNPDVLEDGRPMEIVLEPDRERGTLAVRDTGIGMTPDEIVESLGTIARSGTRNFLESSSTTGDEQTPDLIGQFGVGFYSAFMVASRVEVRSRRAGSGSVGSIWSSDGSETFTVAETPMDLRGTEVILTMKAGMEEYLDPDILRSLVERYSDYIVHPIVLQVPGSDDRPVLNTRVPIWTRAEKEVSDGEYDDFYRHLARDFDPPLARLVFRGEGTVEFQSLVFIPRSKPLLTLLPDQRGGLGLYSRRVMIMPECPDLLPPYLRFVRGVVESPDLPLNISRETLQKDGTAKQIRRALTRRIIDWLESLSTESPALYSSFFSEFGELIKEGILTDPENREKLSRLLRVWTTLSPDAPVSLSTVAGRLPEGMQGIPYITGTDRARMAAHPSIEAVLNAGGEVVLFDSPLDQLMLQFLTEFEGRKLLPLDREGGWEPGLDSAAGSTEELETRFAGLIEYLQGRLGKRVSEVRLSTRLKESPCVLISDRADPGEALRAVMRAANQEVPEYRSILEINPGHPLVEKMAGLFEQDRAGSELELYAELLLDLAAILGGGRPDDPSRFGRVLTEVIAMKKAKNEAGG
ncbi:molecular chaperone HtpG [Candidatus Fermentibacteria bacterium]|nr:molecular chaperone HtpG [Candidatus Fermentibacteria bacterium]